MSKEIIKILDDLGKRFGIAINWSSENITPYLQDLMSKYIDYEVTTSIIWILIALIVIGGCSIGIIAVSKHANKVLEKNDCSDWSFGKYILNFIFVLIIGGFVISIICQALDLFTCYAIPEKKIFEYLGSVLISES